MTAGREQDARETLAEAIHKALKTSNPLPRRSLLAAADAVLALLPSPPATTGAGDGRLHMETAIVVGALGNFIQDVREQDDVDPQYAVDARHLRDALTSGTIRLAAASPPATDGDAADGGLREDWNLVDDFPGWSDLTTEQKGTLSDVLVDEFWRGFRFAEERRTETETP